MVKEDKDETEVEVEEDPKAWIQVLKFIYRPFWCIGHFPVTNIKYYKEMAPIAMRYRNCDVAGFLRRWDLPS